MQYTIWQKYRESLNVPAYLHPWILHEGSFMKHLKQKGILDARVQLLNQSWQFPLTDEKQYTGIPNRTYALVREVLILSEDQKWMVARTIVPRQTLTGKQRQLAGLKNRALGSVLFKEPAISRSEFEMTYLPIKNSYHALLKAAGFQDHRLWARRSLFYWQNKPLLLIEIFLPDMKLL
ncbi:MAG: hypothetical protein ACD_60C00137G0013 [uncultured bacterium]|nr:MAG: hypothetical protein ACD_60C00137G0013 [uncultured bacterium]